MGLTINDKARSYPRGDHILQQRFAHIPVRTVVLLLFLAALVLPSVAKAQNACRDGQIMLDHNTGSIPNLGECLWYLEDPEQSLTIDEVRAAGEDRLTRHHGGVLNFGYTGSAYWTRFDLSTRRLTSRSDWILELALPLVDDV